MRESGFSEVLCTRSAWALAALMTFLVTGVSGQAESSRPIPEPAKHTDGDRLANVWSVRFGSPFIGPAFIRSRRTGVNPGEDAPLPNSVGALLRPIGDQDGDGLADLLVAMGYADGTGVVGGWAVLSAQDGSVLGTERGYVEACCSYSQLGTAVCDLGDLDGDGVSEYAVSAPFSMGDTVSGRVHIYRGGTLERMTVLTEGRASEQCGDRFGETLAAVGDVNGDGVPDLAVGAPVESWGDMPGQVSVWSGADGHRLWALTLSETPDSFGLDLVSCPGHGLLARSRDAVTVLDPADGKMLHRFSVPPDGRFWASTGSGGLHCVGDVNGDGEHDQLVSTSDLPPRIRLTMRDGSSGDAFWSIRSPLLSIAISQFFPLPDQDGDGVVDVVVEIARRRHNPNQAVMCVLSGATGESISKPLPLPEDSRPSLRHVPDIDGDALDEMYLGFHGTEIRRTRWVRGPSIAPRAPVTATAWETDIPRGADGPQIDELGRLLVTLGDVNGDDVPDIIVGLGDMVGLAWQGNVSGGTLVLSGADGTRLALHERSRHNEHAGAALADLGDLDGDGVPDYGVGVPNAPGPWPGIARLYSGSTHELIDTLPTQERYDCLGTSLIGLGDMDGDGVADFAVGAPFDTRAHDKPGHVDAFSGATRDVLWSASISTGSDGFGTALQLCPGHGLLVRAALAVCVLDPQNGKLVRRIPLPDVIPDTERGTDALVCVGDVNGDGEHDLAVYAPRTVWRGGIAILDGRTGSALRVIIGSDESHHLGRTLRTLPDLDGDGLPELLTTETGSVPGASSLVRVLSPKTGESVLPDLVIGYAWDMPPAVTSLGDLDGDGLPELVVSGPDRRVRRISLTR